MSTEGPINDLGETTSNDRLMAALSYPIGIIVSLIILLVEDMKKRPFQKYHAIQSLAINIVLYAIIAITAPFTCGITGILWFISLYWAYQAYQGKYFEIPVITKFCKDQHWI
jgi:uncharacterized membrane protein